MKNADATIALGIVVAILGIAIITILAVYTYRLRRTKLSESDEVPLKILSDQDAFLPGIGVIGSEHAICFFMQARGQGEGLSTSPNWGSFNIIHNPLPTDDRVHGVIFLPTAPLSSMRDWNKPAIVEGKDPTRLPSWRREWEPSLTNPFDTLLARIYNEREKEAGGN
ncbi:hypothetical protein ACHAPU_008060 [Fusarium lateritium]